MCGRFALFSSLSTLKRRFNIKGVTCEVRPSYNIAPTHEVLAILFHNENRLGNLHWGLVSSREKSPASASRRINARAESVSTAPAFRNAFRHRRCLIPADGFYEWQKSADKAYKQPFFVTLPDNSPFVFAGLWETWKNSEGCAYHSCTIITTNSSPCIAHLHERMPVILAPEAAQQWIDPEQRHPDRLIGILNDGLIRELKAYPVSMRVNSVRNNDPSCIEPVKPPGDEPA